MTPNAYCSSGFTKNVVPAIRALIFVCWGLKTNQPPKLSRKSTLAKYSSTRDPQLQQNTRHGSSTPADFIRLQTSEDFSSGLSSYAVRIGGSYLKRRAILNRETQLSATLLLPPPSWEAIKMEIPGYYFDKEKKRYFKVEKSNSAPAASAWSSDNVKRRKLEDEQVAAELRRVKLNKDRIKRSFALNKSVAGGFLVREFDFAGVDIPSAAFAKGLLEKGSIPLADARWRSTGNLKNVCVTNKDTRTGLGVAFATLDELTVISTYIPRDQNGRVHRQLLADYNVPGNHFAAYQEMAIPQISDIKAAGNDRILISSRQPDRDINMWVLSPEDIENHAHPPQTPLWLLSFNNPSSGLFVGQQIPGPGMPDRRRVKDYQANTILPGCDTSTICVLGSNRGILRNLSNGLIQWLAPSVTERRFTSSPKPFSDIFALDFKDSDPNIILAGGRPGKLFLGDIRSSHRDWNFIKHGSSISHIKSLDHFNVLVAGLDNTMYTYDTRMMKVPDPSSPHKSTKPTTPVLEFHEYRNKAHIDIGLDLNKESGIVAAAHDDGKIALYSVKSGHRLESPDIDAVQSKRGPIQSVQFQTMPNDVNPTLFVGVHSNLNAYSFGVRDLKDEA